MLRYSLDKLSTLTLISLSHQTDQQQAFQCPNQQRIDLFRVGVAGCYRCIPKVFTPYRRLTQDCSSVQAMEQSWEHLLIVNELMNEQGIVSQNKH